MPKKDYGINIEKEEIIEDENCEDDFNKVKKLLNEDTENFTKPYILRLLNEKESLRKVFLAVIKFNPAKVSDVVDYTLFYKQNCYPLLSQLVSLNLLKRIFVIDVYNGKEKDDEVMRKFSEWSRTMPENTKRYYLGKTSFWRVTDLGKKFVLRAYEFDQKFREGKK